MINEQADELAHFLLSIPSQDDRAKAMLTVKNQHEHLHAYENLYVLAKEKMDQLRRDS